MLSNYHEKMDAKELYQSQNLQITQNYQQNPQMIIWMIRKFLRKFQSKEIIPAISCSDSNYPTIIGGRKYIRKYMKEAMKVQYLPDSIYMTNQSDEPNDGFQATSKYLTSKYIG